MKMEGILNSGATPIRLNGRLIKYYLGTFLLLQASVIVLQAYVPFRVLLMSICGIGIVILTFSKPMCIPILLAGLLPFQNVDIKIGPLYLSPFDITMYYFIMAQILAFLIAHQKMPRKIQSGRLLVLLGTILILSVLTTHSYGASFKGLVSFTQFVLLYYFTVRLMLRAENPGNYLKLVIGSLIFGVIASSILALYCFYNSPHRVASLFYDPNYYAAYIVPPNLLLIAFALNSQSISKTVLFVLLAGVCFLPLIMTFSRAGWLGFVIGFPVIIGVQTVISSNKMRFLRNMVLLTMSFLLLASIFWLTTGIDLQFVADRFSTVFMGAVDVSLRYRFELAKLGLEMIKNNPVLGVGIGAFQEATKVTSKIPVLRGYAAHNTFIRLGAEAGLVALTIFLVFLGRIYSGVVRRLREVKDYYYHSLLSGLLGGLSATVLIAATIDSLSEPYFWMYLLLCVLSTEVVRTLRSNNTRMSLNS